MKDLAKRIPFKMVMHLNRGKVHQLDYLNADLQIACLITTHYRYEKPVKSERIYGLNRRDAKPYKTLAGLLRANPELARRAAQLYPSPPQ